MIRPGTEEHPDRCSALSKQAGCKDLTKYIPAYQEPGQKGQKLSEVRQKPYIAKEHALMLCGQKPGRARAKRAKTPSGFNAPRRQSTVP